MSNTHNFTDDIVVNSTSGSVGLVINTPAPLITLSDSTNTGNMQLQYNAGLSDSPLGISFSSDGDTYASPVFKMNSRGDIAIGSNLNPSGNSSYTGLILGNAFMMGKKSSGNVYFGANVTYDGQWKSIESGKSSVLTVSKDAVSIYTTDASETTGGGAISLGAEKYTLGADKLIVKPHAAIADMRLSQPLDGQTHTSNNEQIDYILLHQHKDNEPGTARSVNQMISGTITGSRGSTGSYNRKLVIDINSGTAYENTFIVMVNKGGTATTDKNSRCRPVKFTYDSKIYLGLSIPRGSTMGAFEFTGLQRTTGESLKLIHGDDSKISAVSSIETSEMDIPGKVTASGLGLLNKDNPQKETVTLGGGAAGKGGTISLKNSDGNETVGMSGGDGAGSVASTSIKGGLAMKNADGDETMKLDGGATGKGSTLKLKNTDGKETMSMSSGSDGQGGDFSVKNSGGSETFGIAGGDGTSATANTSIKGDLSMKNASGTETLKLDGGSASGGGDISVKNASGNETVSFEGGGTSGGGSQTIKNGSGNTTYQVTGGGASGSSTQTFKNNSGQTTGGSATTGAGTSYKNDAGVETLSLVVTEGGGGLQVNDSDGNSTVNMDGETGGLEVEGTASITNAEIVQTTTETVFVEEKIELTPGATNKAPEFSPTGATATTVRNMYYCPYSNLHFTITAFGQLSRSADGKTWDTCKVIGLGGGAIQSLSSTRLSDGTIRLYADINGAARGSSSSSLMTSDDLGDTWTGQSNYVNMVNSYYAGNRDNTTRTLCIGHDRDVEDESKSQTGFAVSVMNYGVGNQKEYFNDCADDVAMQRRWKRWILSRFKMGAQQLDGDNWRISNPNGNYFGGTTSSSTAYNLLTDAEIDQIHFPIPSWFRRFGSDQSNNIAYSAGWHPFYINSNDYGYDWDLWVSYAGTYPGSCTLTWIIGGLRAMHIHKATGGTINSSFISSQSSTTRPFIMYVNLSLSGWRLVPNVGSNGQGFEGIGTSYGQYMARTGFFIPKEYLQTTSGINMFSESYIGKPYIDPYYIYNLTYGQYEGTTWYEWKTDAPYSSNDSRPKANVQSSRAQVLPHPTDPDCFISVQSTGRITTVDTSNIYNWLRSDLSTGSRRSNYFNPVAPPFRLDYETATVDGVADVFVGDESINPGKFFKDNISIYQLDWEYKNMVGAGNAGVAAQKPLKDTYASESSIWTNTYANGLRVPSFTSLIPHYETASVTGVFPSVYTINSISPISMTGDEEWGSSVLNTSNSRSQNYTFNVDGTHKYSNPDTVRKSPAFTAVESDRSALFVPTSTGWEKIRADGNYSGVNLDSAHAYGFIGRQNTSDVHGTGQVFPGWSTGYQSGSFWIQRADAKWLVTYQMRMNDYSTTLNKPNGGYASLAYTFTDSYPASSSGSTGSGQYLAMSARSTVPGYLYGCHTYVWDGDGLYRGNSNYDKTRFEGYYGVNARICPDNNWWSDAWAQNQPRWAANNMVSRVDGTWHPDSGETLTVAWDGNADRSMHNSSYWTYELWLCSRPNWNSRPVLVHKLRDLSVVSDANYTAGSRSGYTQAAWMQLSKSATLSNKNITQYLTDAAPNENIPGRGYTDANSSSRTEYYLGLVARYKNSSNNTSGVKVKTIRVRSGASAWPDEPYAWQINPEWLYENNVTFPTPFYHTYADREMIVGAHQPGTALMLPRRNTSDHYNVLNQRWMYLRTTDLSINENSQSGWNDLYNNMINQYNSGETVQQIIDAGRGYHPSGTTGTVFPSSPQEIVSSWRAAVCPFYSRNTASNSNNIVREIDGIATMGLVTTTNSNQVVVRKLTVPSEYVDGHSYRVRYLPENNVIYFIFKDLGKIYWGLAGSHSTLTSNLSNQRTGPSWTLISPSETGITNPTDIVYAPSIEKYILVGESGIYITSLNGVNSWESKLFPQYSFAAKPDTGMFKDTDHNLHMCHNGAKKLSLTGDDVKLLIDTEFNANVKVNNLPTSDPGVSGMLWSDSGTLKISN